MASLGHIDEPGGSTRPRLRLKRTGQGYSRFVAVMKLVLPLIAAVMIVTLAAWPQFHDVPERFQLGTTEFIGQATIGHRLINARFTGTDRNFNPYTLTAAALVQRGQSSDVVTLSQPEADFTTGGGAWVAVSAPRGSFARREQTIVLEGGVKLFHDSGYELQSDGVTVDFARSTASSNTPVLGQGPAVNLRAAGFRIPRDGKRIEFIGPARVVLYDNPAEVPR